MQNKKTTLRDISIFVESNKYREEIHSLIPGGAHTYSKGDDQFPALAPAAISRGEGSHVWDIDGNEYLDCAMGLTSVSLGHAYDSVIQAVYKEILNGVNFQRPSALEKVAAELFLSIIPNHQMIKFAKNGSIITTAAIKLARAKTNRKIVAFPFDHPFYSYDDWFIGTTLCNKGVPNEIAELSVTFKSCDINSLRELFEKYPDQIACVITEPEKSTCNSTCECGGFPELFLREAIDLTHKNGAIFIIDEMITGFKTSFPGSTSKYNLDPDLITWGKGIANGFSFCALTGKAEIMQLGGIKNTGDEKVFLISTTHGGETHSLAAAIQTIKTFKEKNVIEYLHKIGNYFIQKNTKVVYSLGLQNNVEILDSCWMPIITFRDSLGEFSNGFKTLVMQEMIKQGVLFQGSFVPCYSHKYEDVDYFADAFYNALIVYKQALEFGFEKYLIGEPVKPVFRRYV